MNDEIPFPNTRYQVRYEYIYHSKDAFFFFTHINISAAIAPKEISHYSHTTVIHIRSSTKKKKKKKNISVSHLG